MRSSDQTLIARMGFSDPDKQDERHDLACRYLAQEQVARLLADRLCPFAPKRRDWEYHNEKKFAGRETGRTLVWRQPRLEQIVFKGEGKYAVPVGYLDAVLPFEVKIACTGLLAKWLGYSKGWGDGIEHSYVDDHCSVMLVAEVKIQKPSLGDLIRQMNLYRCYVQTDHSLTSVAFLVAAPFRFTEQEAEALKGERIHTVFLGDKFNEFVRASKESRPADSVEV